MLLESPLLCRVFVSGIWHLKLFLKCLTVSYQTVLFVLFNEFLIMQDYGLENLSLLSFDAMIVMYCRTPIPFRTPMTYVIGKPIEIVKNPQATREEVIFISWRFSARLFALLCSPRATRKFVCVRHKSHSMTWV